MNRDLQKMKQNLIIEESYKKKYEKLLADFQDLNDITYRLIWKFGPNNEKLTLNQMLAGGHYNIISQWLDNLDRAENEQL